ncbi:MAG TPA: hypothetical protein ENK02_06610 [Planctomycetes bacterium]|nr:hypothetical protein [Planctomycetota bacterium]
MATKKPKIPDWDQLFQFAVAQEGMFTTKQAAEAGFSPQLLSHYLRGRKIIRLRRGIYRLVHYPAGDREDLVLLWLWTEQQGIFSHQTALWLHHLSDLMPAGLDISLPPSWARRRLRIPKGVVLHFQQVLNKDRQWFGPVPATNPARTLRDCAANHLSPEFLQQATQEALRRGLVTQKEIPEVLRALEPFGGVGL